MSKDNVKLTFDPEFSFEEADDERTWVMNSIVSSLTEDREEYDMLYPDIYWGEAVELINAWSKYQAAKKLYINATHPETQHRVKSVVNSHYGGRPERVKSRELELASELDITLADFRMLCDEFGVEPVGVNWLYDNLKTARDYASYRKKCLNRAEKQKEVVSLKELTPRKRKK